MLVHIVYAHPSKSSFTHRLLEAFIAGLEDVGHVHTISDLYAAGFNPVLSPEEYTRESSYAADLPVRADIAAEHALLDAADAWAFVYPVWWTDVPAILKGWFDRVWTVGWAYHPPTLRRARKAVVLCAAGHTADHLRKTGLLQSMEAVMLADRIFDRTDHKEFHLFDGSEALSPAEWEPAERRHLERAGQLAREIATS
jgi:NAD(P)H dehydrogenase (quinone)